MASHGPTFSDRQSIDYTPLHGSILTPECPFIFSTTDISSSFQFEADKWHILCQRIQQTPTLFCGYSLEDAGTLQALNPRTVNYKTHKQKWILLNSSDSATADYFKTMDFSIIVGDVESLLNYFQANIPSKEMESTVHTSAKSLFPSDCVPDKSMGPVRPIKYFYMGCEPTWHDIYSGKIYKTSYYQDIIDKINSGRNNLVIGMPACGKTTLMMQIAADIPFKGYKLMPSRLTKEKAILFQKNLRNNKALIFIDNFADNIEGASFLEKEKNIQLIGFEREYNIDIASHLFDPARYITTNITDINDRDIQGIVGKIPNDIVKQIKGAKQNVNDYPSIYEVVESHVLFPNLRQRFRKVLEELERSSYVLHDLFVMCCYVHKCRVPVSFDMANAFLRNEEDCKLDYTGVYDLIDRLGALIKEHYPAIIDKGEQDYFTPRSIFVSEAVLNEVSQTGLKRTVLSFHKKVSPYRICDYHIFKRYAFDKDIMLRAFPDWSEGRDFYNEIHQKDRSPYTLQQGALYLSRQNRPEEAFKWIDQAVIESGNKVFSIRNSYAIILFRANINSYGDTAIKADTLKESMEILIDCYHDDKRKTYHATTFAEQAIEYWNVYRDVTAKGYLNTAQTWLKAEKSKNGGSGKINRLIRRIELLEGKM